MQNTQTLTLKKSAPSASAGQKQRPERSLVGKAVTLQTRSPTQITGVIQSFEAGWVTITGSERRWQSNGDLSDPVFAEQIDVITASTRPAAAGQENASKAVTRLGLMILLCISRHRDRGFRRSVTAISPKV